MRLTKKILSVIMAACLVAVSMPFTVFANGDTYTKTFEVSNATELSSAVNEINGAIEDGSTYLISITDDFSSNGVAFSNAKSTTTIIGNGHDVTSNVGSFLQAWSGATLNLGDASDATNTLTIKGANYGDDAGAVSAVIGSTINMYAGTTI